MLVGALLLADSCDSCDTLGLNAANCRVDDGRRVLVVTPRTKRLIAAVRLRLEVQTAGKDHRTYDLALSILHEEIEHEAWFSEFLEEGPSGHFRRGTPGTSP